MVQLNMSQDQEQEKERNSTITTKSQKIEITWAHKSIIYLK